MLLSLFSLFLLHGSPEIVSEDGRRAPVHAAANATPTFRPPAGYSFGSDFNQYGVKTTYKVQGVYPSGQVLSRLQQCESDVFRAYMSLPSSQRQQLSTLTLRWTKDQDRGLGGGSSITLKCNDLSTSELTSVFIHEMGHVVDTGLMEGHSSAGPSSYNDARVAIFRDDPSVDFYSISWKNTNTVWKDSSAYDFVTGYAMTDPFEDFAESYDFYLLHGSQFKYAARFNARLSQKYAYLRNEIFSGKEFVNNDTKLDVKKRAYDSTILPFSLEHFLKIS